MAMDFGKLNFAVGFNRTSAFPLDANSYFESYTDAVAAAAGAAVVGSSDSAYYIGQLIIVNESGKFGLYQIGADKTLVKFGQASSADALAVDVATLKSYFTNGIANKASADASGNVITSTYATKTEMNTAIQSAVAGAVQYLGIANSKDDLVAPNSTGDFYRAGTAFDLPAASSQTGAVVKVHVGDLIICEDKETPKWSIIHGEEIGVASIAADGSGVSITGTATNPKVKLNAATTTTLGGVIVGDGLTVDTNGKLNSTAATQITTAINALDVEVINLGAGETVKSISETNGKIAVTTQSISINQSQVDGLSDALDNKLDKALLSVNATNGVTLDNVTYKYELPQANADTLGGVKSTVTGTTADRDYNVEVNSDGTMKVNVPWTDTKITDTNQKITAKSNGSNVTFGNNDTVEVVAGTNVTVTPNTTNKTITIAAKDTNTAHSHSAGVGLTGSGTAGISGTYTYKVNLVDETKASNAASYISGAASKFYAVQLDKNDKLGVYVPWTDTNTFRQIWVNGKDTISTKPVDLKDGTNIVISYVKGTTSEEITIDHTGPGSASQTTTGTKAEPNLVEDGGTVAFGAEFYVPSFGIDANGHTRDLKMTKYSLPTPETYSLSVATATTLGGIKAGNSSNNFKGELPNTVAEVAVNGTTGLATVNLENIVGGSDLDWVFDEEHSTRIEIKQVSTDKLVQGTSTLIINGGGANW